MTTYSIDDIADPLDRPAGKRNIESSLRNGALRAINEGEFVRVSSAYLHHGIGGFAVVFRVRNPATGTEVALRCWKRPDPPADTQERAEAFARFVVAHPSPYLLQQQFFARAIYICGDYRAAILMPWVHGSPLRNAVDALCAAKQTDRLVALATAFGQMVVTLQGSGIGHGDLQHDNIFVRPDDSLCLIDYDSVFVPGMIENETCPVGGMEGYGHPDYVSGAVVRPSNAFLDTFSAVVIGASLHILAQTPGLFGTRSTENLLFTGDDVSDPKGSALVRDLQTKYAGVEPIAALLSALVAMRDDRSLAQVPFASVYPLARKRTVRPPRFVAPALPSPAPVLTWKTFAPTQFAATPSSPPSPSISEGLFAL